jgi:hypothetical protein
MFIELYLPSVYNIVMHSENGQMLRKRKMFKNLKIKIHKNIILSVVLYGCETWSLALREERRLRVFEKWVL